MWFEITSKLAKRMAYVYDENRKMMEKWASLAGPLSRLIKSADLNLICRIYTQPSFGNLPAKMPSVFLFGDTEGIHLSA